MCAPDHRGSDDGSSGATGSKPGSAQNAIGIAWQEKGDHTRAIAAFDEAIRLNPASSAFYFNRAKSWGLKKNYARSIADLDEAVRRDPANAQAYRVRGMTMAQIGNSREAFADLDKAISISSGDPKSYFERALVWEASDPDKALADLDKAIALDPANSDYRKERLSVQISKRRAAGDEGKTGPAQNPEQPKAAAAAPKPQIVRPNLTATDDTLAAKTLETKDQRALQAILGGDAWLDMGKYDKAIGSYDVVVALEPDNRFGYFGRGTARAARAEYGQAIADFDRVTQLAPNFAAAYFRRGLAKVTSGDVDGALADCDRAAKLDAKAREAHYCKGMAWHAKGDAGRAIAAYSVAIGIDPKDDASFYARGMARADRKDYAGAIADFDQALKLDPGNADYAVARKAAATASGQSDGADAANGTDLRTAMPLLKRGDAFYAKRKYDRAVAEYSRALALAPNEPSTYSARARARMQKGDYDGALSDINRALEIDPSYITAYHARALILIKKREPEKAIADYNRAIEMKPDYAPLYFGRGSAWYSMGDFDRAAADLDRALELDPKSDMARQGRKLAMAAKERALVTKKSGRLASQAGKQTPAPQALTHADIDAEIQKQDSQILKAIAEEFPDDYSALIDNVMVVARLGGKRAVRDTSRVTVAKLRRRYAPLLPSTPDNEASQALSAQLGMLNYLMTRQTPATCNNYLRKGPDAVSAPDSEFLVHQDKIGATLFRAFGAAKRSGLPAAEPADQDWSLVAEAFTRGGGTPTEMDAIANANPDFAGLCPATAKLFAAALSLSGEPGRHVKTALLYAIVKN
ncbi:hypothetical protein DPM33_26720 [Mesorhizobium hawassense]|uniref:Uncharacterized protein n=1 Tax=Mesorhizobium hawassense TaxID=1209954 RepID=A0A330HEW4_9HYPH|nr:tetratricopeptide repeat protein [Mesorhizobium hawassense]RAZ86945.1 hypothetical protein DPM33_26720 [Mesorhizobium hawassense]